MRKKSLIMILIGIFLYFSAPIGGESFHQDPEISQEQLEEILKKCADYCEKLSNSVLDFICIENITEELNTYLSKRESMEVFDTEYGQLALHRPSIKDINSYIYDYQMIWKDNKITDRRILLRENGRKMNEVDAKLKTKRFQIQNIIFGPIALLDIIWQPQYDYKIIRKDKFKNDNVIVIEATPKDTNRTSNPYGKAWIKENDFSIVKIEWAQESLSDLDFYVEDAKKFKSEPVIEIVAEYAFEKNGIRFPSRYYINEIYYREGKKYFTRSNMFVTYRRYKFFTVKSDVKYFGLPF